MNLPADSEMFKCAVHRLSIMTLVESMRDGRRCIQQSLVCVVVFTELTDVETHMSSSGKTSVCCLTGAGRLKGNTAVFSICLSLCTPSA